MNLHLRGTVLPDGRERDLFVTADGALTFDGSRDDAETILDGGFLIPGLVDMHAHLGLASPAPESAPPEEQVRASALQQLDAGVLAIREPGGPHHASTGLGPADGLPRVFAAGRFLAPPGGYLPGLGRPVPEEELADAALEELAAGGGGWVKVIGDWFDGTRFTSNYSPEALDAVARAVHNAGGRIAIHTTNPESLDAALDARFDSLEHCSRLTGGMLDRVAAAGSALVPTLTINDDLPGFLQALGVSPDEREATLRDIEALPEVLRQAVEKGIRVLAGTDAGLGPHGMVAGEVGRLMAAGIAAETAIGAASWDARAFLGLPGIEEGAPADLVAFERDPREDPAVLAKPLLIALAGTRVR